MRKLILIAGLAIASVGLTGCEVRKNQKEACEREGGKYFTSTDADDDVCVFTKDPNTRVKFHEDDA